MDNDAAQQKGFLGPDYYGERDENGVDLSLIRENTAALAATAEFVRMNKIDVPIIALEDLIRIKEYLGRPKDREALLQLKAIRRIRGDPSE